MLGQNDNIKIILGPPGTGKTTYLLNVVDDYLARGFSTKTIGFISFTRKSVTEARTRAAERFNRNPDWFTYFKTIHSLAFTQLGLSTGNVLGRREYRELGNSLGLRIAGTSTANAETGDVGIGDQLVFTESLSRLCLEPLSDTFDRINPDFSWEELDLFSRSLKKYKQTKLLIDFTDMLERYVTAGIVTPLEVLLVDEAQDLCPLQWRIVERLMANSKTVYLAGDDDQAIFRWSGADVKYFIGLAKKYEVTVLDKSYRLSRAVYRLSTETVKKISIRNPKKYKPRNVSGEVIYVNGLDDVNLDAGTWLILVRNVFLMEGIVPHLRSLGYSYETPGDVPREAASLRSALTWEKLRKGRKLPMSEVREIFTYMSINKFKNNPKKVIDKIPDDKQLDLIDLVNWTGLINDREIWHEALDKISPEDREYYIAARRRNESLVGEPRIRVSTIHGAKGGEADHVVLFTDMSARTFRGMSENYDDEVRVFYVGITRARETLHVVQPRTQYYFTL